MNETEPTDARDLLVLLVDDSRLARSVLRRILTQMDLALPQVVEAADGAEGLAKAKSVRPDLVLADINMPVLDGFGLLKGLKSDPDTRDIPVVMVTVEGEDWVSREAISLGAAGLLAKPFTLESFMEILNPFGVRLKREAEGGL